MSEENPLKVRKMESTHIIDMSPGASNKFMMRAIELAKKAGIEERSGGCFGAVVVKNGEIVGEGYNQVFTTFDPTCHAEVRFHYCSTHLP
jgi:tRNA(Arg) A34 adenosine deaminase TadA